MASPAVLWALSMAGTATSIIQNTSGFPLLRRIREDGDAAAYSRAPTLIMTVTTLQIGLYGIFLYGYPDGLQLVFGNVVGFCTWLITFSVMLHYTHGVRAKSVFAAQYALAVAWGVLLPVCVFSVPTLPQATKQVVVAVFMQAANISGFLSPVSSLRVALRERDLRKTPGMLSYVNVVNSSLWTSYGFALGDMWIAIPNVLGVVLAGAQVAVMVFIYFARKKMAILAEGATAPAEMPLDAPAKGGAQQPDSLSGEGAHVANAEHLSARYVKQ